MIIIDVYIKELDIGIFDILCCFVVICEICIVFMICICILIVFVIFFNIGWKFVILVFVFRNFICRNILFVV